ncbi:Plant intracellular Ras-group-related LRR protein 5 [Heracleum sosnowskyi]|uniref:Plant intracellular Ras-group-related LRR protein 5 n=1 Tax=Heracleum sosnowskyi TaxID=360622 RepID=A0AAD8GXJ2_9APIA|nr:Plant intracellular Ras-group-related LRR protein 5 [Heracleum sosnowskyi]
MTILNNKDTSPAYTEAVEEIMRIYRSLPPRPSIEELEAAISLVKTVDSEEKLKLDQLSSQLPPQDMPPEIFSVLQQVKENMVLFQSHEQSKEALEMLEVDKFYQKFDELIQTASELVSGGAQIELGEESEVLGLPLVKNSSVTKVVDFSSGGKGIEKLSLMKVAALFESTAKSEEKDQVVLDLEGKLMDNIEWLPVSLGKLSQIVELNLSNNKLMVLPTSISGLTALRKLDVHANQLMNLPDSFGELSNLYDLDLHANKLKTLPISFGDLKNLVSFDLSSNHFTTLPEIIGNLTSLEILNVETNELAELPYTIGSCTSLVELRLDFNQLRGLPEAIGKLEMLEVFSFHYNRVGKLPTTMGNLTKLRELDASFNELEGIPESFCLALNLEKLNVGKNFSDLRTLPRSIGNLEKLEVLDISDDQIRVLPDSFRFLSKLRVFHAYETPLEVPPKQIVALGAQAVVQYMEDIVVNRDGKVHQPKKRKGFWSRLCCIFSSDSE